MTEGQHQTLKTYGKEIIPRFAGVAASPSRRSANSVGRLSAGQWPLTISSGAMFRRSATSRRKKSGGKKRSLVQSTNFVGTFGHASSGHGKLLSACDG